MRPPGDYAQALYRAASTPATVRDHCERAQVGYGVGRYTATRMLQRGDLVRVPATSSAPRCGPGRPPMVVVAASAVRDGLDAVTQVMQTSFWERPGPSLDTEGSPDFHVDSFVAGYSLKTD